LDRRVRAYVGLGSNVGQPEITLARAVVALAALPRSSVRGVSRLYATTPVGVLDQPDFFNAVVAIDVPAGPEPAAGALHLLAQLKELERAFGRRRGRRWGPRVLDLDLLLFGRARLAIERTADLVGQTALGPAAASGQPPGARLLEVPHRDIAERLFVLAPLSDLAPSLAPPGWHATVATARRQREQLEGPDAARVVGAWNRTSGNWT